MMDKRGAQKLRKFEWLARTASANVASWEKTVHNLADQHAPVIEIDQRLEAA